MSCRPQFIVRFALCLSVAFALPGCMGETGKGTPLARLAVSGTVTLDGQPLATGNIILKDATGAGGGDAGTITNGKFSLQATPGKKKVEITSVGESTENVAGKEGVKEVKSLVPPKYNLNTELTAEVASGKPTELPEFKLSTK